MSRLTRTLAVASLLVASCGGSPRPAHVAGGSGFELSEAPAPETATPLGTVAVVDGDGCGLLAKRGDRARAERKLRELAEARGADHVVITKREEPHYDRERGCMNHEYHLEGVAYRIAAATAAPPPSVSAVVSSEPSPAPAPTAEPYVPAPAMAPASAAPVECAPACGPGYDCVAGACSPRCDPPCGSGALCRADRVCVPATP